jgi:hypothetical protein
MKRLLLVAALALSVGGCTRDDVYRTIDAVTAFVQTSLQAGRAGIRSYCSSLGKAENEAVALQVAASSGSCKAVARTRAIVDVNRAVCLNVDLLTDAEVGNYSRVLVQAYRDARAALKAGC